MSEMIENPMVIDEIWDEIEYGIPSKRRLKRERVAYEDTENGIYDEE